MKKTTQQEARKFGTQVEEWVAERLQQQGLKLLQHGFQCPVGEIDLIMQDHNTTVFIEIKYRRQTQYGSGLEAVTLTKQKRIIKTAQWYLQKHPHLAKAPCRFDVIAIHSQEQQWHWVKHAFEAY